MSYTRQQAEIKLRRALIAAGESRFFSVERRAPLAVLAAFGAAFLACLPYIRRIAPNFSLLIFRAFSVSRVISSSVRV